MDARCQDSKPAPGQPAQLQDSQLLSQIFIPTQVWGSRQDGQSALAQLGLSCPLGQETPGTLTELPGAWLAPGQQSSGWSLKRQPIAPILSSPTTSPQPSPSSLLENDTHNPAQRNLTRLVVLRCSCWRPPAKGQPTMSAGRSGWGLGWALRGKLRPRSPWPGLFLFLSIETQKGAS